MKRTSLSLLIILLLLGCSDGYPEFGDGYRVWGDGGYATYVLNPQNSVVIPEYILDYAVDSTFILIAQSPLDSLPRMKIPYYSDNHRRKIAADPNVFRQYWIINKMDSSVFSYDPINQARSFSNVYGPFAKEDYETLRGKLNVPVNLRIESE
jgi:hypothetical protein